MVKSLGRSDKALNEKPLLSVVLVVHAILKDRMKHATKMMKKRKVVDGMQ